MKPGWGLHRPVRILVLLSLILALVRPTFEKSSTGLDLWVLLDRSASANSLTEPQMEEWRSLLEKAKPSSSDKLHFLHYAEEVASETDNPEEILNRNSLTNTKLALLHAASRQDPSRQGRILLFSDGYATGEVESALEVLSQSRIPLDLRVIGQGYAQDLRISDFSISPQVKSREPFLISASLSGLNEGTFPVQLFRDGQLLSTKEVTFQDGEASVEWVDRLTQNGSYQYRIHCQAPEDPVPGNNTSAGWVQVTGGAEILLLSKYKNDPIISVLERFSLSVDHFTETQDVTPGRLSGYRAVIINNVPSHELKPEFIDALPFYVEEQGGGLAMIGGKESFGSGGYFQSKIDPLLPVSMEVKDEHRKLSVAMAIVMDRSGSMGMQVAGGQTKMQLANSGAATALDLLGAMDEIAVLPVDSKPFKSVGLTRIGNKKSSLTSKIMDIRSGGGGIYVYNGLVAGWDELKKAQAGTKHLILFSDAMDTVQPDQYKKLLKEITDEGASVSVIGLGHDYDTYGDLLKDIAERGNGRIFFTDQPTTLPQIFAQETVTIARSTFIDDPIATGQTGKWVEVSPASLNWLTEVDGYNLCYLREGASTSLISKDDYRAPLIAHSQKGLGRTLAVTFPLGGEFSQRARKWDDYGNFIQTFTRWLVGEDTPPGIALRSEQDGTSYKLELHYDTEQWGEKLSLNPPSLRSRFLDASEVLGQDWRRLSPGLYQVRYELPAGRPLQGIVKVGDHTLPFGPIGTSQSAEWDFSEEKRKNLRNLSYQSGGRLLLDLKKAWKTPPIPTRQTVFYPFLIAALLLLLLDAFLTRTGWSFSAKGLEFSRPQLRKDRSQKTVKKKQPTEKKKKESVKKPVEPVVPATPPQKKSDLKSRFNRAKERK